MEDRLTLCHSSPLSRGQRAGDRVGIYQAGGWIPFAALKRGLTKQPHPTKARVALRPRAHTLNSPKASEWLGGPQKKLNRKLLVLGRV